MVITVIWRTPEVCKTYPSQLFSSYKTHAMLLIIAGSNILVIFMVINAL